MKSLNEDMKNGNYKQIYLLYGEEAYLKRSYKEKMKNAMRLHKELNVVIIRVIII